MIGLINLLTMVSIIMLIKTHQFFLKTILFIESVLSMISGSNFLLNVESGVLGKILISSSILFSFVNFAETVYTGGFYQLPIFTGNNTQLDNDKYSQGFVNKCLIIINSYFSVIGFFIFNIAVYFYKKTMETKKIMVIIVSVLLTIFIITVGISVAVNWPKYKDTKKQSQDNQDSKTHSYQDLEKLKNDFDHSFHEVDLKNFKDATEEFKKSQKVFIDAYRPKLNNFQLEFNQVEQKNHTQINDLYQKYESIVNQCATEVEILKQSYTNTKISYHDLF